MSKTVIGRAFDELTAKTKDFEKAVRESQNEIKTLNQGLKLDPTNVDLLNQKYEAYGRQLESVTGKAEVYKQQIALLNERKQANGQLTEQETAQLERLEKQMFAASVEAKGLAGAIENHSAASEVAEERTKTFGQSMTELQSNLRAANQVLRGVTNSFLLFGGDRDSAIGQFLTKQAPKLMSAFSGIISMGKLLKNSNDMVRNSFLGISAAVGGFLIADTILNQFGGTTRTVMGAIVTVLAAGTIAWVAFHTAMSAGLKTAFILAAIGAGVAGVKAMLPSAGSIDASTGVSSATASVTTSQMATSSQPVYAGSGASGGVTVQTLSEKQIESAVARAIESTGLNQKQYIGKAEINKRELVRFLFNDFLSENSERGHPLLSKTTQSLFY